MLDRRIAPGLIENENVARVGGRQAGVEIVVFRQVGGLQPLNPDTRAIQDRAVVKRVTSEDAFQAGWSGRVEMDAEIVKQ